MHLHTATKILVAFGPPILQNCFVMSDCIGSSEPGSRPKAYCHSTVLLMFTKCFHQELSYRILAETNRLTITNIQPEDEGLYACVAKEGDNEQRVVIAGCVIDHGKRVYVNCIYMYYVQCFTRLSLLVSLALLLPIHSVVGVYHCYLLNPNLVAWNKTLLWATTNNCTHCSFFHFPRSFSLGTARSYDDTTEYITARSGEDVTLPTAVVFVNAGHCGVSPEYTQAGLQYEPDMSVLFHCNEMPCLEDSATHSYNFSALGNVTLHPPVNPGPYFMVLIQMCPSPVLRMTYNVIIGKTNIRRWHIDMWLWRVYHRLQLTRFELGLAGIAISGICSLRGCVRAKYRNCYWKCKSNWFHFY